MQWLGNRHSLWQIKYQSTLCKKSLKWQRLSVPHKKILRHVAISQSTPHAAFVEVAIVR